MVLTLRMCDFVKTERNTLLMEGFPYQVSSFGRNVVVLFAKDLLCGAPRGLVFYIFFRF